MMDGATQLRDMLPLVGVIIGGALSFLSVFVSNIYFHNRRLKSDSKNLAMAFHGEINAILEIVRIRKYIEGLDEAIVSIDRTGKPADIGLRVRRNYFSVYEHNVGKIGILDGALPVRIALFYTIGNAILEDIDRFTDEPPDEWPADVLKDTYLELRQLFHTVQNIGSEILDDVDSRYDTSNSRTTFAID